MNDQRVTQRLVIASRNIDAALSALRRDQSLEARDLIAEAARKLAEVQEPSGG